jgi:hypothetical protein
MDTVDDGSFRVRSSALVETYTAPQWRESRRTRHLLGLGAGDLDALVDRSKLFVLRAGSLAAEGHLGLDDPGRGQAPHAEDVVADQVAVVLTLGRGRVRAASKDVSCRPARKVVSSAARQRRRTWRLAPRPASLKATQVKAWAMPDVCSDHCGKCSA